MPKRTTKKPAKKATKRRAKAPKKSAKKRAPMKGAKTAKKQPPEQKSAKTAKKQPPEQKGAKTAKKKAPEQKSAKTAKKQPPEQKSAKTAKKQAPEQKSAKKKAATSPSAQPATATPPDGSAAAKLIDEAMAEASFGNLARAAELMLQAADTDPTDWRLPNEAGVFYFRLERYDDALRCYERTLTIVPNDVPVLMNRALVFVLTGDDARAHAALQKVLEIDPIHAPAFFELGKLHQKVREYEVALQCFDTALAHETMGTLFNMSGAPPQNARLVFLVMLNKARTYFALDRPDEGVRQAQTLWEQFEDADALLKLARELSEQVRNDEAARVVDVLLAAQPDHAEARQIRARL